MEALDNFTNHGHRIWQLRRVQGIFVYPTPHLEMGSGTAGWLQRCVRQCDVSVVCKREKIRTGLSDGKSSASGNAQQSMRFDTQKGGLVYQRAFGWHLVPETRT